MVFLCSWSRRGELKLGTPRSVPLAVLKHFKLLVCLQDPHKDESNTPLPFRTRLGLILSTSVPTAKASLTPLATKLRQWTRFGRNGVVPKQLLSKAFDSISVPKRNFSQKTTRGRVKEREEAEK